MSATLAGLLLAAVLSGTAIDLSRWRDAAAQRASAALGRPVELQGALQLRLGRELGFRIGAVRILQAPGLAAPPLLSLGELRASIGWFDALRGRWRLRSIEASDAVLRLERAADGRALWTLATPRDAAAPRASIDIERFALQRLRIDYHDARSATRRVIDVDALHGSARSNEPLRLGLRGRFAEDFGFALELDGAALQRLLDAHEPWPFTLAVHSAGARLRAGGTLNAQRGEASLRFDADAEDLAALAQRLGLTLPSGPWGAASLRGTLAAAGQTVELADLQGRLGETAFAGRLALAFGGERPRLSGALHATAVDLGPLLAGDANPQRRPLDDEALAQWRWLLRGLSALDADLAVKVERWLGLPLELRDTQLQLQADTHGVHVPIGASLGGVPLAGRLDIDRAAPIPAFALQLAAEQLVLGSLAQGLTRSTGLEGTLGRVELRLGGRGGTPGALLHDLQLSLALAGARLRHRGVAGGRAIAFTLDTLELAARRGERLRGRARGSLLGERATLALRAGSLPDMLLAGAAPVELELALAQARLRIQPRLALAGAARDTALRFDFQARRSGDLARWLAVAPESQLPVALRGRLRSDGHAWQLDAAALRLGRSELAIDARRSRGALRPLTTVSVKSPLIDVQELATLRRAAGRSPGPRIDAPMLSAALELGDADIALELQRVRLGGTELAGVQLVARSRDGRLLPSSASGRLAGAPFTAQAELELRGELPWASLQLSATDIDVGRLLRELGVAEDIDGRAGALQLRLQGRGNSLRQFAAQAGFEARLSGGRVTLRGAAQRGVAEIQLHQATLGAAPGEPLQLRLAGALDQTPLQLELRSGTLAALAALAADARRVPFAMAAHAAGARLSLEGEVALPLGRDAQLVLPMDGERLDTLNGLARVELPPWGPWSLRGPIRTTPSGYELQGLQLAVGRSRLGGSGRLELGGPRPHLQLQLAAPSIQLDDFPAPQRLASPAAPRGHADSLRAAASRLAGRSDTLLSASFLRRLDASIEVKAKEVLSGSDRLADGVLQLQLRSGRLHLDPVVVNLPGGTLRLSMSYDLKESEVDFALAAQIERFDYGIIARRLRRAGDVRGLFSLDLQLAGTAPSLQSLMAHANGKLDVAVWPTELRSGVFDLWSVNLLLALLPLIDPGSQAQVNCVVARFDLKQGMLRDDKILIDTSALRILGAGHADLGSEELAFVFRPRAKGFALFRLQTPLRVSGTLGDQRFGFRHSDMAASVLRLIASPILLPIERLTQGPLPRDGADVCTQPLRGGVG